MIQILEVAKKNFKFLLKLSSIKNKQTNIQTMNKRSGIPSREINMIF